MTYNSKNSSRCSGLTPREAVENAIDLSKKDDAFWDDNLPTSDTSGKNNSSDFVASIPSKISA